MTRPIEEFLTALKGRLRKQLSREAVAEVMADVRSGRVVEDGYGNVHVRTAMSDEIVSGEPEVLLDLLSGELIGGASEADRRGKRPVTDEELKAKDAATYGAYRL